MFVIVSSMVHVKVYIFFKHQEEEDNVYKIKRQVLYAEPNNLLKQADSGLLECSKLTMLIFFGYNWAKDIHLSEWKR